MAALYEQAFEQLMRTGRVGLRDEDYGNLYAIVLAYTKSSSGTTTPTMSTSPSPTATARSIKSTWCAYLEKILAL